MRLVGLFFTHFSKRICVSIEVYVDVSIIEEAVVAHLTIDSLL